MGSPCVTLDDIAGLEEAKETLQEAVRQHLTGVWTQPRSVLLYGAPGTGKTLLLRAIEGEVASSQFYRVSSYDLVSRWLGQNQELVRELFVRACTHQPSVVCLDDVEGFCGAEGEAPREAARKELLLQMQGALQNNAGLLVLGATAVPWRLDCEVTRSFEHHVCIPMPGDRSRALIFKQQLKGVLNSLTEADFTSLALRTDGFTGADISILVRDALLQPVRRLQRATHFRRVRGRRYNQATEEDDLLTPCCPGDAGAIEMTWEEVVDLAEPIICMGDLLKSFENTKPSVDQGYLEKIQRFTEEVQSST
ncbi:vacuolar protein sorting-associated protein 4B-like isoform X2 [Alosa sapidissima]|uniref:vacuolar protein sorting-associated protein 4B-like isoform X2 n=1 Tax=Alosa sapidissima TaxID=34773 RepID=UPI001C096791|nr:vacuolar protein sorting-associated protein 4B-like isoform X2 [Alosa sapidissima]